jgi:hypothetical protein
MPLGLAQRFGHGGVRGVDDRRSSTFRDGPGSIASPITEGY